MVGERRALWGGDAKKDPVVDEQLKRVQPSMRRVAVLLDPPRGLYLVD